MAGSWNSRMAKLRSRDNWYKGKQEVDPPDEQISESDGGQESSRMETVKVRIRIRSKSRLRDDHLYVVTRIGVKTDEVRRKTLKTGENHPPDSMVGTPPGHDIKTEEASETNWDNT